jgi:methylglutaconyl-CoA hydratase
MKFIKISEADGVVEVILNRPDLRNAFNPDMILEIKKCFQTLSKRKDLRVVVLKGEGKSFCAGADLNWMRESVKYNLAKNKKDAEGLFDMFQAVASCSHPVVGVVHGAAFGGALGLIAACDVVVCEERTSFGFSEVKLGIAPAVISHFVLQKCTLGKAGPLMISGRTFSALEAKDVGLVHSVVNENEMTSALDQVLNSFGEAGPEAVRETKKLLFKVKGATLSKAKTLTTNVIAKRRVSAEGQEGLKGFLEKKDPAWKALWKVRS